jgi:hypothetical protein
VSCGGSLHFKFENMAEVGGFCGAGENMVNVLQFSRIS